MIQFFVPGVPKPGGSKRAFRNPRTGKIIVTEDCKGTKGWRESVVWAAREEYQGALLEGPLVLRVTFYVVRPKGHYGTGRNAGTLKKSAPPWPTTKPDATKLLRSTEDALTKIIWRDDSQIVEQRVLKRYAESFQTVGALITIQEAKEKAA